MRVDPWDAVVIDFDYRSVDSYERFLDVRRCPVYSFRGTRALVPARFADRLGMEVESTGRELEYTPLPTLFDYQRDIARIAIEKRRYAVFAQCGLGKTLILLEFAKHAAAASGGRILIVSPLMVIDQTISEAKRWYGDSLPIERVPAAHLAEWIDQRRTGRVGITNYEAIRPGLRQGSLAGLVLDESSMLKSHYGAWGTRLIELGRGLEWKLAATGTPAPNDRVEYANHAVFLDRVRTVHEFLATYFVNRGQTQGRWELKPHAVGPFYRSLSEWSIFLEDPATYGWKDNVGTTPPIHVHIEHVPMTDEQLRAAREVTGDLIAFNPGGLTQRRRLSQIAKGKGGIPTNKPAFIRSLVDSWPDESTIIWCEFNDEQETLSRVFPEAVNITGATPHETRLEGIQRFVSGSANVLISKPSILGFGLNLQVATRQVFSGIRDSYESFWQAVKRSNRVGSTRPLNVHIPVTEIERHFIENVLRKAGRVEEDAREQERLFRERAEDYGVV